MHIQNTQHLPGRKGWQLLLLLLICCLSSVFVPRAQAQGKPFKGNLGSIIRELEKKWPAYQFLYDFDALQTRRVDKIPNVATQTHEQVLYMLNKEGYLNYRIDGNAISITVLPAPVPKKNPGKVTGKIVDEDNGEPVAGASIQIGTATTIADMNGSFTLSLPAGTYTAMASAAEYGTKAISELEVRDNQIADLNITLKRERGQLGGVTVKASAKKESVRALLIMQKNSASMTNGISAEHIRATPDNNVAQVLKRVSGVTVQGEKFVTIRGVSDRYNNVLINGASLPSTEPNRRNFSFDIVPSQLVDNIVVNKTASPDLPGEFTGGLIQVNTKDVPTRNFLSITMGTGFNTASANQHLLGYKRDEKAWLGKVDDNRKYYGDGRLLDPVKYFKYRNDGNEEAIRNIGRQIPNRWQFHQYLYEPSRNYHLSGGVNHRFKKSSLGFVAAVTYLNEMFREEGVAKVISQYEFDSERHRYNTTIGGLFNMTFKSSNHRFTLKNLYNKRYSNQFDLRSGNYISAGWDARRTGEVTLDNRLLHTRLEGEHKITNGGLKVDWYADYIRLLRDQPDTRFITARQESGPSSEDKYSYNFGDILLTLGGIHSSLLEEKKINAGSNFILPFNLLKRRQIIKVGYAWSERKADFDAANFRIRESGPYAESMQGAPYYKITVPDAFGRGDLVYYPTGTRAESLGDRYTGNQQLKASYLMVDFQPLEDLRLTGGVRYENNTMKLSTIYYNYGTGLPYFSDSAYFEKDWLPSVNVIYNLTERIGLRVAFSKTLARPDFVERSPYLYYDFTELAEVFGQKSLQVSRINNYDIRFEYYPSGDEILSASLFHKDFSNPVERFYHIGATTNLVEYKNLYKATATGIELDVRKSLAFIDPGKVWLKNVYVSGNYTYLKGEIQYIVTKSPVTDKDTNYVANSGRPIQGLSPYIINGALNYQSKNWGFNVSYNRIGRRIVNGGTNQYLIQFENPRDVVDVQLSVRLMRQKMQMKINLADILNQSVIIYSNTDFSQGITTPPGENNDPHGEGFNEKLDLINYKVKRGANISISLTYNL